MQPQVLTLENNNGGLLPFEFLRQIGLNLGDQLEVAVKDRALVVRSLPDAERAKLIATATREVFDERREAYEELAKGAA